MGIVISRRTLVKKVFANIWSGLELEVGVGLGLRLGLRLGLALGLVQDFEKLVCQKTHIGCQQTMFAYKNFISTSGIRWTSGVVLLARWHIQKKAIHTEEYRNV